MFTVQQTGQYDHCVITPTIATDVVKHYKACPLVLRSSFKAFFLA